MNTETFRAQLADYVLSGHALLHIPSTERTRLLSELKQLSQTLGEKGRQLFVWSHAGGWRDAEGSPAPDLTSPPDPQKVCQEILDLPEESLFVLCEFGHYVNARTYSYADVVIAWLCEVRDTLAATGRTVLFVGAEFTVPPALLNDVTTVDFPLPDDDAIEQSVRFVMEKRPLDEASLPAIVAACRGMTQQQVEDRVALALRKFKALSGDASRLILREKAEVIRRSGLLRFLEPPAQGLAGIGGAEAVKAHIRRDKACFSPDARQFGIEPPRGILLTGIPGCGKTAISLAAAAELGVSLLQFDVGALMSKWVGESESNTRSALRQVESMSPCVLQLDEVEKGFGAVGSDGDGGAGLRTFGTLLKWMSERTCAVYLIMTANDVSKLPPEFTRKGRVDEIFGVFLPTAAERAQIFRIHLDQRQRDPEQLDLDSLAEATGGYSGADIEQVVVTGLKLAFHAGQELTMEHLQTATPEVRPLSRTDPQRVAAITSWLEGHTKPAGGSADEAVSARKTRVRRVAT